MATSGNSMSGCDMSNAAVLTTTERRERILCQCGGPCIVVEQKNVDDIYHTTLEDFENRMEECLDSQAQPLHYRPRDDFSWLGCRRPLFCLESILGLEEESKTSSGERKISIRVYQPVECTKVDRGLDNMSSSFEETKTTSSCCPDAMPTLSWNRFDEKNLLMQSDSDINSSSNHVDDTIHPIILEWYDFAPFQDFSLKSTDSCCHFLRTLLDGHHDASPWVPQHVKRAGDKDIVVMVVPRQSLKEEDQEGELATLVNFRVSNACPSWFLHATGHCTNVQNLPWLSSAASLQLLMYQQQELAFLIYRRLTPRDCLTAQHPKSKQPVTCPGSLWLTLVVLPTIDSSILQVQTCEVAPPISDPATEYPGLLDPLLEPNILDELRREAEQVAHWTAWPEQQHYKAMSETGEAPWNVFPLCHCFPAHDLSKRHWVPITCSVVPRTVELLKQHLGGTLRTALLSRLDPHAVLEAHSGWEDLANYVLRIHIPLTVPPPGDLCGIWVDGCVQLHKLGQALCFDDSKTHRAFNYSSRSRIVLILDLIRPSNMPLGTAKGGHSDELDAFIKKMGVAR